MEPKIMTSEEIEALPYRPCVGVMLVNEGGQIFVGQRIDNDTPAWQMPQGGIDEGEKPRDAALRELEEETGIYPGMVEIEAESDIWLTYELPHELVPNIWKGQFRGQEQKWFLIRFKGQDSDIRIETAHPEFSEWRWMPASELVANIVPFKKAVYKQVLAEFRRKI